MADYFSFDEVLSELDLSEDDLKRMVSEGELRAFRDENKMKFKREDVQHLRKGHVSEPTIILPSTPGSQGGNETVLDLDIGQETAELTDAVEASSPAAAGEEMGVIEFAEEPDAPADTGLADDSATLELDEADLQISEDTEISVDSDDTFIEEEESVDTGLTTEPLGLADETLEAEVVEDGDTEETEASPAAKKKKKKKDKKKGRRAPAMATTGASAGIEEEIEAQRPHWIWTILMLLAFVSTTFSGLFFYDLMRQESGKSDQPLNLSTDIATFVLEQFWEDPEWTKFHTREYIKPPPTEKLPGFVMGDWYSKHSFDKPDRLRREGPE